MAAIDVHTHAFPDEIAARAIEKLSASADWQAVGGGTVDDLLASMDAADIDVSVVCPIATKPDQVRGILKWCKKIRSDRIEPFPSVHPETPKAGKWLEKFAEAGFAGIKLHPMYQDFAADEDRLDPIYEAACRLGLAVTIHCGRDIAFPPDDDRASPERLRRVLDRHPSLTLICTHLGGWKDWDAVRKHLLGTTAWLETSFSLGFLPPDEARDLIVSHGHQKVMLGSDWPWTRQDESIAQIETLGLTDRQQRDILVTNAARLLGY
jgi:hypothetical protein